MSGALATLVLGPGLAGVALLVAGRRADRVAGLLAVVTTAVVLVLAAVVAVARPRLSVPFLGVVPGGDLRLEVDGLSAVLVVLVAAVGLLTTVFAVADLPADAARARFCGWFLLFVAAMLTTVTAGTVPALLLAWELMGATSYALIGYRWQQPGTVGAGTRAFLTTRAADLGLYVAAGAALAGTGSLVLADLTAADGGWGTWPRPACWSRRWASRPSCPSPPGCPRRCGGPARSAHCCTPPPWSRPAATCSCGSSRCSRPPAGRPRRRPGPGP